MLHILFLTTGCNIRKALISKIKPIILCYIEIYKHMRV